MIIVAFIFLSFSLVVDGSSSQYVISKVKIKSSLIGKDRFIAHYLNEVGDYFDQAQHKRSLLFLKQELIDDGYLNASVNDMLIADELSKTIAVTLILDSGKRFTVDDIKIRTTGNRIQDNLINEMYELLQPLLESFAEKRTIDEYEKRLYALLLHKGYIKPIVKLTQKKVKDNTLVELVYNITLSERYEFRFIGNNFFSTSDLLSDLYSLFEQGISLPPGLIAQDIQDLYKKKGFIKAKIHWQEDLEIVTFSIAEGERYAIGNVQIIEEFTDGPSLEIFAKLEMGLKKLPSYDEEQIDMLLNKTSLDLANLGYWNLVIDKKISSSEKTHRVDLSISITQAGTEGSPKRLMALNVLIPGYEEIVQYGPCAEWVGLKTARPVTPSEIDTQKRWIMNFLNSKGYQSAHLSYAVDKNLTLIWTVDKLIGPVRFGSVQIVGLQKMKPFIVGRELLFKEGDVLDRQKIDHSIKRLQGLHMFESITCTPESTVEETKGGKTIYLKPIRIKCCEDDPYEVLTRFGLQFVSKSFTNLSWTTWKLGGSFIWKNPTGYADRLMLDADWTRYTINLSGGYELPWLGRWPVRTLIKLYSDRFDQPLVSNRNHRLYKEAHDGVSVTFNYRHPLWVSSVRSGLEINQLSGISRELARVIQFEPTLVDQRIPYLYCEPSVTFEHFDDKNNPSRGFFSTFSFKAMAPPGLSNGWFVKALLEQSLFYPLYYSVIGAVRWRVGHIFNAKFSTILPTERFYLGGANSLRGYETNMVPPLNDVICEGKSIWVPIGGKSMANINAELRFPLYKELSGVAFTDMGILTQDRFADIAANKWLGASGFGLRLASPIGPIRFDIGWKWKKRDPQDKSLAFFFTLGHAF
jgi:outer membrane protein assembly factor BamA